MQMYYTAIVSSFIALPHRDRAPSSLIVLRGLRSGRGLVRERVCHQASRSVKQSHQPQCCCCCCSRILWQKVSPSHYLWEGRERER